MKFAIGIWLILAAFAQATNLEFAEITKDINAAADATTVIAEFTFTNKSDKTVTITKSDSGCSCLKVEIADGKLKYAPGESGVVRTQFEMGNVSGVVDKIVALWLDNDPAEQPSLQLTLRIHVPVLIALAPKTLTWELGAPLEPKTIEIRMAEGQSIRVTSVTTSSELYVCELKTLEEGKKYDLRVTPKPMETPGMCVIRIETDCPITKQRVQQAFAVVRRPLPSTVKP